MKRRIFILGGQRSGTTFTSLAVAGHPDCYLWVNGKLLYYLIVWIVRNPSLAPAHPRYDEIAHALQRRPILGVPQEDVEAVTLRYASGEIGRGLTSLHDPSSTARELWERTFASLTCAPLAGEKYNEYLLQLDDILPIFPDAYFLFIHRDPYEVAASMLLAFREKSWCPPTAGDALRKWTYWNKAWVDRRGRIAAERRMEIGYEEIVSAPGEALARIFAFAGLEARTGLADHFAERTVRRSAGRIVSSEFRNDTEFASVCEALGYAP